MTLVVLACMPLIIISAFIHTKFIMQSASKVGWRWGWTQRGWAAVVFGAAR